MLALGNYHVGRALGEGATGRVRLGCHNHTGQLVALKIVPSNFVMHGGHIAQAVRREIAVLRLIASGDSAVEGVLALHDVVKTEDATILALEYCDGGDLFDILLQHGRLPAHVARDYFTQLVKALHACHQRGVCHRDLKPENILVSTDGSLRIADFGMSGLLNPTALLETSCGSPHYCAPEVLTGQRYSGSGADIWSLGVILFTMITGGLPFDDDNLGRLARKVCSGVFYMPPEVPEAVASLLRQMLIVNPEDRLSLESVLQCDWLQEGTIPCVTPPTPRKQLSFPQVPVSDPDPEILGFLADLGLGNDYMLRRRLGGKRNCIERQMYYRFVAVSSKNPPEDDHTPSPLTYTPTSITENLYRHEQAVLGESLVKIQLSEAFKPDITLHCTDTATVAICEAHDGNVVVHEYCDVQQDLRPPPLDIQEATVSCPAWLSIFHAPGNCV